MCNKCLMTKRMKKINIKINQHSNSMTLKHNFIYKKEASFLIRFKRINLL